MVARKSDAEARQDAGPGEALNPWVAALERAFRSSAGALSLPAAHLRRDAVIWLGSLCVALGAIGRIAIVAGRPGPAVILAAVGTVAWAVVRLAILQVTLPKLSSRKVTEAWAFGACVWVAALTPILAAIAWAVSAAITYRVLVMSVPVRDARRSIAIAWGVQAAGVLALWLARNISVALLAGG